MRRRDFIKVIGTSAAAWPFAARAQQQMPVIGWLFALSAQAGQPTLTAFRKALGHRLKITECLLLTQSGHSVLRIVATRNDDWPHSVGHKSLL